jgi:hypothetical protein
VVFLRCRSAGRQGHGHAEGLHFKAPPHARPRRINGGSIQPSWLPPELVPTPKGRPVLNVTNYLSLPA